MKTISKMALGVVGLLMIPNAFADVTCEGKIHDIYKWSDKQTLSIRINTPEGLTNWIGMPSQSDESMALTAFASGKSVQLRWGDNVSYNKCIDGWPENTKLEGWWLIKG